jgi:hypothetical protein
LEKLSLNSLSGDGLGAARRCTRYGPLLEYTIARTVLLERPHTELQSDLRHKRREIRRSYEQLANLEVEYREPGTVYQCAPGQHANLAISFALLAWTAHHPHFEIGMRRRTVIFAAHNAGRARLHTILERLMHSLAPVFLIIEEHI